MAGEGADGARAARPRRAGRALLVFGAFALLCLAVLRPALRGELVSDDFAYLVSHPYTAPLGLENVLAMFDPWGPAKLYTANYEPVHLLLVAIEREIFADRVFGYHLVNVLVHAAGAALLVALLRASRVPRVGAALGGLVFAVHPANVEAVAWISQLKSCAALALALGALLSRERRPLLATSLFTLALLTKASAAFAFPMAAAFAWVRRGGSREWAWLAAWALLLALYAVPQSAAFAHLGSVEVAAYADPWVHLRSVAAVGARYLVMAASSYGVSAFQEPAPALSRFDPWWLASLPAGLLLAWRLVRGLRLRREEAAWWVGAAAAFAPVSQVFPFLVPVADRYLYFILPGLIGGTLLWAGELRERLSVALGDAKSALLARGAALAALALCALFAVHGASRAALWRGETYLLLDAARHYPDGGTASYLRAQRAALRGETDAAVAALRDAAGKGIDRFMTLERDPALASLRGDPAFRALLHEMAGRWLARAQERGYSTQAELRVVALAHRVREEYGLAADALERALRAGGPLDAEIRAELAALRAAAGETGDGARHRPRRP